MIEAYFRFDADMVEKRLGSLYEKAPVVMSRAANRTAATVAKTMRQEGAKRYRITSANIGKTIRTQRATYTFPYAAVKSTGEHVNLAKFRVTPNRPVNILQSGERSPGAYRASVRQGQSEVYLTGTKKPFIAVMKNGYVGMFRRKNLRTIEGVAGPSVPQMLKNTEIMHVIDTNASEMMQKRLEHEISRMLEGGN